METMYAVIQMKHPIVLPISLTERVQVPSVVLREKHPIVLAIILTEHVQVPLVVQEQ